MVDYQDKAGNYMEQEQYKYEPVEKMLFANKSSNLKLCTTLLVYDPISSHDFSFVP